MSMESSNLKWQKNSEEVKLIIKDIMGGEDKNMETNRWNSYVQRE